MLKVLNALVAMSEQLAEKVNEELTEGTSEKTKEISFDEVFRVTVLKSLPSGEIRIESGADGVYIVFDADCLDALPICKAACCGHPGTYIKPEELPLLNEIAEEIKKTIVVEHNGRLLMRRESDGLCACLDRKTRTCNIYEDRPHVCRAFHCSRGIARGFKLYGASRQQEYQ